MNVIKLTTDDFTLLVVTEELHQTYKKASKRISHINKATSLSYESTYKSFRRLPIESPNSDHLVDYQPKDYIPPLFYENKDYLIELEFNKQVENPRVFTRTKNEGKNFIERKRHGHTILTRNLNFRNDIGQHDLTIRYMKNGKSVEKVLGFEVFPVKLDFKSDYNQILRDIHEEYAYLVLDYLKKTYTSFKSSPATSNDLIWWQVFGSLYHKIVRAIRLIINKPHNRLTQRKTYKKADKIKKVSPQLEEKIARNRQNHSKYYQITEKINSIDTVENQFVKHALNELLKRYKRIHINLVDTFKNELSKEFKEELNQVESTLKDLNHHPFFKRVSTFKGFQQESLVLQNKAGYASFFRYWIILKKGIDFWEGIRDLELKNIAQLYQIWCFIGIKKMVEEIVDHKPDDVQLAKTILEKFNIIVKKGSTSQITFQGKDYPDIELIHEYSVTPNTPESVTSYTVKQQPDIVLKIEKNDLKEDYTFTYLFDAKYRLENKNTGIDYPPPDAINQMHRYRDAIYYQSPIHNKKGKEVIGGYVLYPGDGSQKDFSKSSYIKSIEEVNIGAFPLRPNDKTNSSDILKNHLKIIIESDSETILNEVVSQKGYFYQEFNPHVLVGIVPTTKQREYLTVESRPIYHTPRFPRKFGYDELQYFAPYFSEHGIDFYFKIEGYALKKRNEIFPQTHPLFKNETKTYLVLELGEKIYLDDTHKIVGGNISTFRYTNLYNVKNPTDNRIKMITDFS